ncbi:MAG: lysophospholipid acyltransferase family protein [Gammaproteobacteria bacterium]
MKLAYRFFGILPLHGASAMGGFLGRTIGPWLKRDKVARKNIKRAIPGIDDNQINKIIGEMWDNLGRVFGEFPHMGKLDKEDYKMITTVEGVEHIENAKRGGRGSIFFSGHNANWEVAPKTLAIHDCPLALVYRPGNNPAIDHLIQQTRSYYQSQSVPKGKQGSRRLVRILHEAGHVGMLMDQKMNDGMKVNFFGLGAMTAPAIATLALRFDCPIIPVRVIRVKGPRFKVTIFPPFEIIKTDDHEADVLAIMTRINAILESWISENPGQWIWVHNRWPKDSDIV